MVVPTSAEKHPKEELPVNADQDLNCPRIRGAAFVCNILHMLMGSPSEQIVFFAMIWDLVCYRQTGTTCLNSMHLH